MQLGPLQETLMETFKGAVIDSEEDGFPFLAVITNADGDVIGSFPVRTRADGEAAIAEGLKELAERDPS